MLGGTEVSTSGSVETSVVAHEETVAEFIRRSQLPDNEANSPARLGDSQPQPGNTALPSPPATPLHPSSIENSISYGNSLPIPVRAPSVSFSDNTDTDCPQPLPALLSDGESDGWNDDDVENVGAVPGVDGENAGVSPSQADGQASSLSMLPASLKHSPALAAAFSASLLDRINALRLLVLDTDGAPVVPINHLRMRMRLGHLVVAPSASVSRSRSARMRSANPAGDTAALILTALNTEDDDDSNPASAQGTDLSDTSDQESNLSVYDDWSISGSGGVAHSHLCPLNWPHSSPQYASELGAYSEHRNFPPPCSSHATPITLGPSLLSASSSSSISTNISSSFSNCPCVLCKNPSSPLETLQSELDQEDLDHCVEIASNEDILTNPDLDLCLQHYRDEKPSDTKFFFKVNQPTSSTSIDTQEAQESSASSALPAQNLIYSKRRRLTAWQDRFADFTATAHEYKLKAFLQVGKKFSDRSSKWIQRRRTDGAAPLPPASTSGDADNYLVDLVEFHQQNSFWERPSGSRSVTDVRLVEDTEILDAATVACEGCVLLEQTRHRLRERVRLHRQQTRDDEDDTDDDDEDEEDSDDEDDESDDDSESGDEEDNWRAPRYGVVSRHARSHIGPRAGDDADAQFLDDEEGLFDQEYAEGGNGEDSDETEEDELDTEENSEENDSDDDDESDESDDDSDEESDSTFEWNDDECEEGFLDDYTHKVQELIGLQEVVWQLDHIAWAGR
ncbi:hypothetical protein HDU81_010101 [Chytriomyces hyalinus]|nr:hypothetical protein HDU81_010101 [Chytriomyces hyalinus]